MWDLEEGYSYQLKRVTDGGVHECRITGCPLVWMSC